MEDEAEYKNLPLEEKVIHKQWKARLEGYTECAKHFATITDPKSPEFTKFAGLMKKFVTDANAVALDKALDAVLVYVKEASIASKTVGEVIPGIIKKCLAAPKKSTQDKALDIILMYCEIEKHEAVEEELIKGFNQKNPKVVSACVRCVTAAIREFGNKVIFIKPLVKSIGPLLEDRDKNVREEAKKMVVEMYRWVKEALKPQLTSLKPIQITELEAEFEKLGNEKAVPVRLLRSQQELAERVQETQGEDGTEAADEPDEEKEVDPLDLMDAVSILDKLPKDFYEQIEAKKWQDRKEALSGILPLCQSPKIEPGDYGDLVRALKKVIGKDANVMLVALAGQCLAGLGNGLKEKFSPYAISCLETILAKFKEKKTNVLSAMREASDAVFKGTNVDNAQEVIIASLNIKNPTVKSETASFLARSFCYTTPTILNKKLLKTYTLELIKILNDPDPNARDSGAEALGTAMKVVGEKAMEPFIADVEQIKKNKIKEYFDKAEIKVKIVAPKPKPVAAKPKPKAVRGRGGAAKKPVKKAAPPPSEDEFEASGPAETPPRAPPSAKPRGGLAKRGGRTVAALKEVNMDNLPLLQVNQCKQQRVKDEQRLRVLRWDFTTPRPDFIIQLKDQMETANLNEQLLVNMFHQDFKFHLKALDSLQKDLSVNKDACVANLDLILRWISIRFFDTNPSVIIRAMDYLTQVFTLLSEDSYKLLDFEAYSFLPFLVLKFGEAKETIRSPAQNICSLICHIYPASKVSPYILDGLKSKNARQRVVCLESLTSMIEKFGMTVCQPSVGSALKEIAKQIGDRDNTVRNAALNALVQVYQREGEKLYKLVGNLAEKDRSLLEERIKRAPKTVKPVIKKPEPDTTVVKGGADPAPPPSRIGRVVPTAAQPAPFVRNRPVSAETTGRMQINYEHYEKLLDGPDEVPWSAKLEEVGDIDAIFKDVQFPVLRSKLAHQSVTATTKYNQSIVNNNTTDISDHVTSVISDITNPDVTTVLVALSQLDELICDDTKRCHLEHHVDRLLTAITHQYTFVRSTKMSDDLMPKEECIRIYRSLNNCTISIFENEDLGTLASRDVLHDTIHSVIGILVDKRLPDMEDGSKIIRTLNLLVGKMIEKAKFTHIFSALLKLLKESVGNDVNSKFTELVMKCNWRTIRHLPSKSKDLNVVDALEQIHEFMLAYPPASWADKPSDIVLRTIKTAAHELVKTYGNAIVNYLAKVPNTQGSELQRYIMKAINTQKSASNQTVVKEKNKPSAEKPKKLSGTPRLVLKDIFRSMAKQENPEKSVAQLYEFKLNNPDADLDPYFKDCSPLFKNYIERGLKKVEMDRKREALMRNVSSGSSNSSGGHGNPLQGIANSKVKDLVEDFKAIAMEGGFDDEYIDAAVKRVYSGSCDRLK